MKEEDLVKEAHERFAELEEVERPLRRLWIEDLKMAHGDSDNNWQWSPDDINSRTGKTTVTINKIKQHNRQITNDARENKVEIKIKAEGNGAHKKTADAIQGIIKHICKVSKADTAVDTAFDFAVDAGIGYWYITTDYIDDTSNDKHVLIKPVPNPLNVYLCEGEEFDGSDSPFGFIFKDMRKQEFQAKYPDAELTGWDSQETEWMKKDKIRVAHYYKLIEKDDRLYFNEDGQSMKLSDVKDSEQRKALKASGLKSRPVKNKKVMCYLIAGNQLLNEYEWIGTTIPIVPCKGEEKIIDGELYRAGNTRLIKEPQRILNYEKSCEVEFKKLQGKTPWVGPYEAFSGFEQLWDTANIINHSRLPYNHKDDNGDEIPSPRRVEPPMSSQAYITGIELAEKDMQGVSGQFDAQMGQNVNQQSGKALLAVQSRGLISTYNFIDNKARALKRTGEILLEIIPKIYDIESVKRIIGDDEKEKEISINPEQPEAYREVKKPDGSIMEIYNPGVGRYMVDVQVGANYGTRRQESFNALTEIAGKDPKFMDIAGDIYFEIGDFPMSDKIAERYGKALAPGMAEPKEGETPQIPPEVQQKLQDSEQIIKAMDEAIQKMQSELESKELDRDKLSIERAKTENAILNTAAQYMPPDAVSTIAMNMLNDLKQWQLKEDSEEQQAQPENAISPEQPEQENQMQPQQPQQQLDRIDELKMIMLELYKSINAPKKVIRDESGQIVGVEIDN